MTISSSKLKNVDVVCFTMFNISGDGKLNLTELNFMTRCLFEMQPKCKELSSIPLSKLTSLFLLSVFKERITQSSAVKEKFLLEFGKAVEKSQTGSVSFSDFLFIMTEFSSTLEVLRIAKNLLHPREFTPAIRERLLSGRRKKERSVLFLTFPFFSRLRRVGVYRLLINKNL
jgi:hypothetical protein